MTYYWARQTTKTGTLMLGGILLGLWVLTGVAAPQEPIARPLRIFFRGSHAQTESFRAALAEHCAREGLDFGRSFSLRSHRLGGEERLPPAGHWDLAIGYSWHTVASRREELQPLPGQSPEHPARLLRLLPYVVAPATTGRLQSLEELPPGDSEAELAPDPVAEHPFGIALAQLRSAGQLQSLKRLLAGFSRHHLLKSEAIRRQRPGKGAWLCFLAQQGDVLPPKARLYGARYYALLAKGAHKPQLAAVALRLFLADPGARNIGLAPEPSLAVRFAPAPSRQEIASVLGSRPQAQAPEGERPPSSDSVEFLLLLGFGSLFVVLVLRSHRKLRRA